MRKFILLLIVFLFLGSFAETLRGGVSEDCIPDGFFGSWGVISKLNSSSNAVIFNSESRDIWTLSGYGNILILENLESGARSQITVQDKNHDGKTLKFQRQNTVKTRDGKTVYKETVIIVLSGNRFSGSDNFVVEEYKNDTMTKRNTANYTVSGVKIAGSN